MCLWCTHRSCGGAYFLSNTALLAYGFLPAKLVVIGIVWGFFELLLGSIVGSKLYRDAK